MDKIQDKEFSIDFGAIVTKYAKYWWLFLLSLILCMGGAALYLYKTAPIYHVLSYILVDDDSQSSGAGAAVLKSLTGGLAKSKVDDEVIAFNAHEIRYQMVRELKLNRSYFERKNIFKMVNHYRTSPVEIDAPDELFDTLSIGMRFLVDVKKDGKVNVKVKNGRFTTLAKEKGLTLPANVKTPYGTFTLNKTKNFKSGKSYDLTILVAGNDAMAEAIQEKLYIKQATKKANVIYVRVADSNTTRGKDIINTMQRIYNDRGQQDKDILAINTGKFIDERLEIIYKELATSESNIEAYKRAHNIIDVGQQAKAVISKQEAAAAKALDLETRYRIVSMIQDFIANPENKYSYIPFSSDSTAASGSIAAYNGLILKRMKLENSALPNNQALMELNTQIDNMRANVAHGINNTLNALRMEIDQAKRVSNSSLGEMGNMPTQERHVLDLYRDQQIQNALYTFLLQKREENALTLAATTPKGKVIDHAFALTRPDSPKKSMVLAVALLMTLLLPIIVLYLKNLFTTKFSNQSELESLVNVPVLGEICHNRHSTDLVVRPGKSSSIVELFRLVRNNLQFMLASPDDKVVLVTSSVSGEGKSFVSANVASSFALLGKKVALVGLDIRRPKFAEMLSLNDVPGVTSYLSQPSITLSDIKQSARDIDNLDVFVGGAIPPNPSELLLSDRTRQFIEELKQNYDIVVLDSAPVAVVSDTLSLSHYAAVTLFVTRANFTRRNVIRYFNSLVERGQLTNVAMVINDTKSKTSQGYGYGEIDEG